MGDPKGFLDHQRSGPRRRAVKSRLDDWQEVYLYSSFGEANLAIQASRCMDCGIPFCNDCCPLGNVIPDWNDLVHKDRWSEGLERLHATNNFPEFTGRLCPAPCEAGCVLGISEDPVSIKLVELSLVERGWANGWIEPVPPRHETGKRVAVVGSGPAGLAASQQLRRAGHHVVCYERAPRLGGLLRYGIPEFKMEKQYLDRRLAQIEQEGVEFIVNVEIGIDVHAGELQSQFDAIVLAGGATQWRDLPIPGRQLDGIHQAMEFLPPANLVQEGNLSEHPFAATGRDVIIIGGGDTGADCLGTALRHRANSVHQFEIMPMPPTERADFTPWPTWPLVYRTSSAHEEGGVREFSISTVRFVGDRAGRVEGLETVRVTQRVEEGTVSFEPVAGSEETFKADLVLLAMGFVGPERSPMLEQFGVDISDRGLVSRDSSWATSVDNVFVCGDMGRGQSLIVWAIAEGRAVAAAVDEALMGRSELPKPISPTAQAMR